MTARRLRGVDKYLLGARATGDGDGERACAVVRTR